jgi:2'-5' RNA ligase
MSQTIRAFIAIELPPAVVSVLEDVQQNLKALRLKARWVRPENIHLTLKFLGDIDPGDVAKLHRAMMAAAAGSAPFSLALGGIGVFPDPKRPRVVWAGFAGSMQPLMDLQRNLEDRLAEAGFPKDKRAFKGHLTLGRFKDRTDAGLIRQAMDRYPHLEGGPFEVARLILFRSELNPSGAVYTRLKQADLRNEKIED